MSTAGPAEPLVERRINRPAGPGAGPVPPLTKAEPSSRMKAGHQQPERMLFIRGKAMSGAPIISGTNQLPKPPIIAGMTMKNTMINPWAVISTFQCAGPRRNWRCRADGQPWSGPGCPARPARRA